MMRTALRYLSISFLPLLTILMNCSGTDLETQETQWPDGSIHERWTVSQNNEEIFIRQGNYQSWYENGQLFEEGEYLNDKKHGLWTRWHGTDPNIKIVEGQYVNGEMDGRWHFWMDPSHISPGDTTLHSMHNSDKGSTAIEGHPKSHKFAEYKMGLPHGLSLSRHHNGQVADSFYYVDGKLEGIYISYYPNGQKATIANYKNGVRQVKQIFWDENGKVISEIE